MTNSPFDELLNRCPPAMTREGIERVTDGAIRARTLANLDCRGEGIPGRFYCGRKAMYPTVNFIEFLKSRSRWK